MLPTKRDQPTATALASPGGTPPAASAETTADPEATTDALLRRAATAAEGDRMSLEEFMHRAWTAFVDARPGLRDHLADTQLLQQIQELRAQGRVAQA